MVITRFVLLSLMIFLAVGQVEAQGPNVGEEAENDYYDKGRRAYDNGDLIGAIKFLFAYKVSKKDSLNENPEFLAAVDAVIEQSEKALRAALDNQKQMERWLAKTPQGVGGMYGWEWPETTSSASPMQGQIVKYQLLEKQIELKRLELEKLHVEAELSKENKRENK